MPHLTGCRLLFYTLAVSVTVRSFVVTMNQRPDRSHALSSVLSRQSAVPDSAASLRAMIDLAPIGLAQFDLQGRFLQVNDRLCDILGCSRDRLVAQTFQEITFPDDLPNCLELTARLAANEIPNYCVEKRFVRPDGSVVWTRITVSAVRNGDGTISFFIGAAEDVTAQVVAAQALRTAEERLRTALDASMIGTFRFDVRRNTLDWADGLDRVFGSGEHRTLEQFLAVMHPDDRPHLLAAYTKSASEGADLEEEFRVVWPDGSVHWLHDRGRTFLGGDGRAEYIIGAITDITNHKRMEQVIAEREAQFRTLANSIPQLAWIAHPDGSRSWFNERWYEYTGASSEEMSGFGWMGVHASATDAEHVLAAQRTAFARGGSWQDTVALRRADGEHRWFLSCAMPVLGPTGTVRQWFGTNTDITDRKSAEDEREQMLRAAEQARAEAEHSTAIRQQVLGFVAHDLRSPLQAVLLASSALLDLPHTPEQQRRRAEMIKRCAKEMDRLIADLLDASRMEAGTFAVRLESMDVGSVLAEILERCQPAARTRDVHLQSELEADLGEIRGDEQRFGQAISNLVTNAIKFTPAGGCVCVRARRRGAQVEIVVQDTGCGIATDALPSIFDRFWQANRTSGGAGLGLAIVKGIVESHGGEIAVESTEGHGTTFRILVPSVV